jgi:RNA methyltransferase, TrmH family
MPLTKAALQRLRALRDKKHREADGHYVVESVKVVRELLAAGVAFDELYVTSAWPGGPPPGAIELTPVEMARASHYPTPSPVLAVGRITRPALAPDELSRGLTLALDGVQDPGNVGTLLRLADWFGLDRVLLSPGCADRHGQKVINASMGSFVRIRAIDTDLPGPLAAAAAVGVPVLGCDLAGDDVAALPALRDAVVVIGGEGRGLSPAVAATLTRRVTIPRHGRAESLNAAVAAGIVCAVLRMKG